MLLNYSKENRNLEFGHIIYSCLFTIAVVFMGSEKYPDENGFDNFIKLSGGNNNAFTECERVSIHLSLINHSITGN